MTESFTPQNSALVLVDYQVGTLQLIRTRLADESLRNAVILAKAAKALGIPVVLTSSQEDHIQGAIAPALQAVLPEAHAQRVKRPGIVNAWADPTFKAAVQATGRRMLIMGGVTTDICLVFPSISAVKDVSRRRMEREGVVLTTTNTVVAELVQDWSTPEGSELVKLLAATAPTMQAAE